DAGPPATAPAAGPAPSGEDWTADAVAAAFAATGRIVLEGTDFATGSTTILGGPTPRLQALADWLKADPKRRVAVVGHSDWTGSVEANLKVSRARAAAVAQQLAGLGIPVARIRVDGVGPLAPLAPNGDPAGLQANRRVEVVQLPDAG
ncbi:MAG: OmpA family protein, partial [Mangrovicoccus sp.]|nr:OmpA family protein [Mangrovicoccus sp.]